MPDTVIVEPMDDRAENSPIAVSAEDKTTVMLATAQRICVWNGREFQDGERVSDAGEIYECSLGHWVKKS